MKPTWYLYQAYLRKEGWLSIDMADVEEMEQQLVEIHEEAMAKRDLAYDALCRECKARETA